MLLIAAVAEIEFSAIGGRDGHLHPGRCSPAGMAAEMRLPFFRSGVTASLNSTASSRLKVTRSGVVRREADEFETHA